MEAKIKYEWTGHNGIELVPCIFEETVILSDEMGFDKNEYTGWYVSDEDLNSEGIYTKYWHHSASEYKKDWLNEFDETKCRKILKSSLNK